MPMVTFDTRYSVGMVDDKPAANAVLTLRLPTDGNGGIRPEFINSETVIFNEPLTSSWGIFLSETPACRARSMVFSAPSWEEISVQLEKMEGRMIGHLETVVSRNKLSATQPSDSTIVVGIGEGPEVEIAEDLPMTLSEEGDQRFVMNEFGLDALPCSKAATWVAHNFNAIRGPYQATWDKMDTSRRYAIARAYILEHGPREQKRGWVDWADNHGSLPF